MTARIMPTKDKPRQQDKMPSRDKTLPTAENIACFGFLALRRTLQLGDEIERLVEENKELRLNHTGEGTFRCTCNSYPHHPNCGLDERLIAAESRLAALREEIKLLPPHFKREGTDFVEWVPRYIYQELWDAAQAIALKSNPTARAGERVDADQRR